MSELENEGEGEVKKASKFCYRNFESKKSEV
jgi:hypothetical protein